MQFLHPSEFHEPLNQFKDQFDLQLASVKNLEELEATRINFLGRKSQFNTLRKQLGLLDNTEKAFLGAQINELAEYMQVTLSEKQQGLEAEKLNKQLKAEAIDVTMPGQLANTTGAPHPLQVVMNDMVNIFYGLGYQCLDDNECPEVETEYYNFDALNFPADHPAKDMQDTYYCNTAPHVLLRSQTSNAQIRYMEKMIAAGKTPPYKIICPGRVYRNEDVSSRKSVLFHQVEGLCISESTTLADLKGTLLAFAKLFFGGERNIRLRSSYFPFTEPSVEVDVECILCQGKGCRTCSQTGWLEVLGAGMVHPNVLSACGIDANKYQGFAFGMGVERMAMLKYAIDDIRLFYTNDTRFLAQFKPQLAH